VRFLDTSIPGVVVIDPERHGDDRGYFTRTWCARELAEHGLEPTLAQCSVSHNTTRGTLRGLHWQVPPQAETKMVRCTRGAIFDVAVDLRPGSPTFLRWFGTELTSEKGRALYVPRGFAHGFLTLEDSTDVEYQISSEFSPGHARGIRWNDPALEIGWPCPVEVIAARDRDYPDLDVHSLEPLRGL
jgi:dTDP-4-dehydrorhamnose 3,5-epimerase